MPKECRVEAFRTELRRRGLPRRYAGRAAQELAEHWEDLRQEAELTGVSSEEAELFANDTLGNWDQLAAAFHAAHFKGSLPVRYSFMFFFFGPLLLFTVLCVSLFAFGAMAGYLAGWWGSGSSLNARDWAMLGVGVRAGHAGTVIITQAAFCWLAWRYRLGLRGATYSAVGLSMYSMIHQVTYRTPSMGNRGALLWTFGLGDDLWSGIALFVSLAALSWLISKRLSKATHRRLGLGMRGLMSDGSET